MTTNHEIDTELNALRDVLLQLLLQSDGRLPLADGDALAGRLAALTEQIRETGADAITAANLESVLTLQRARAALAGGDLAGARLLLAALAASPTADAQRLPAVLRLEAVIARRLGRPDEAAALLGKAEDAAGADLLQVALLRSERVLALADDEQWAEALAIARQPLEVDLAEDPEALAARSEAVAVLAAHGGDSAAALGAADQALALRESLGDAAGWLRAAGLRLQIGPDLALQALAQQRAAASGRGDLWLRIALAGARRELAAGALGVAAAAALAALAAADGTPADQLAALDLHAVACLQVGDLDAAAASAEQAVRLAEVLEAPRWLRRAQVRHAQLTALQGDAEAALHQAAAVASAAVASDDAQVLVRAWLIAGPLLHRQGRLQEAETLLRQASAVAAERQLPVLSAEALVELGRVQLSGQQWSGAHTTFEAASELATASGLYSLALDAARGAVLALRGGGDAAAATARAQTALAAAAGHAPGPAQAGPYIELAQLAIDAGELATASSWLQAIPDTATAAIRGEAAILRARLALSSGGPDAALTPLLHAIGLLRGGPARSLGAAQFLLGQVYGLLGEHEAAGRWLGEALVLTTQHRLPEQHLVAEVLRRAQRAATHAPPTAEA